MEGGGRESGGGGGSSGDTNRNFGPLTRLKERQRGKEQTAGLIKINSDAAVTITLLIYTGMQTRHGKSNLKKKKSQKL